MPALSPVYSSPSEAHTQRDGGRAFYGERGRSHQAKRSEERDRHHSREENEAAALGLGLANLARQFPQFKASLNQLRNHLLMQVKPMSLKYRIVLSVLSAEPLSIEEIMYETTTIVNPHIGYHSAGVDRAAVLEILASLRDAGKAEQCTCDGDEIRIRSNGKPSEKVYWWLTCEGAERTDSQ